MCSWWRTHSLRFNDIACARADEEEVMGVVGLLDGKRLTDIRTRTLGTQINAEAEDVQLVENATAGTVIAVQRWQEQFWQGEYKRGEDAVLLLDVCYGYVWLLVYFLSLTPLPFVSCTGRIQLLVDTREAKMPSCLWAFASRGAASR